MIRLINKPAFLTNKFNLPLRSTPVSFGKKTNEQDTLTISSKNSLKDLIKEISLTKSLTDEQFSKLNEYASQGKLTGLKKKSYEDLIKKLIEYHVEKKINTDDDNNNSALKQSMLLYLITPGKNIDDPDDPTMIIEFRKKFKSSQIDKMLQMPFKITSKDQSYTPIETLKIMNCIARSLTAHIEEHMNNIENFMPDESEGNLEDFSGFDPSKLGPEDNYEEMKDICFLQILTEGITYNLAEFTKELKDNPSAPYNREDTEIRINKASVMLDLLPIATFVDDEDIEEILFDGFFRTFDKTIKDIMRNEKDPEYKKALAEMMQKKIIDKVEKTIPLMDEYEQETFNSKLPEMKGLVKKISANWFVA